MYSSIKYRWSELSWPPLLEKSSVILSSYRYVNISHFSEGFKSNDMLEKHQVYIRIGNH
jgi:hypothetical protein